MNVDPLARWYRWIEYAVFGGVLEHHRFIFFDRLAAARSILILGEGDGRSLARVLDIAPHAEIDVVESSARMIGLAKGRVVGNGRVHFHQHDAANMTWPPAKYDAIVTSFFLDCFDEATARRIIERLAQSLRPQGLWLVNDFAIPPSGWRRGHARAWIAAMYLFFRVTTGLRTNRLPPIDALLEQAGLRQVESVSSDDGMIVSQVWSPRTTMAGPR